MPEQQDNVQEEVWSPGTKLVSQVDQRGYFLWALEADESPLEPGVFHIPGGAVDVAPPEVIPEGQCAKLVDGAWVLEPLPEPAPAPGQQPPAEEPLEVLVARACYNIDREVDEVIFMVLGNRAQEYLQAEAEATAFSDAGYPEDDVPATIQSDMVAFERSAQEAAMSILAQAAAWREAQGQMRAARLLHKQVARKATTVQELGTVLQAWAQVMQQIRAGLGV